MSDSKFANTTNSKEIAKDLTEAIKKDNHPLDVFVKKIVNSILVEFAVPWLVDCLKKYEETDFHTKMSDPTWDYINDWETNHHKRFKAFVMGARKLRYAYDFDSQTITSKVVGILQDNGWRISDSESIQLYYTMESLRQMIEE